MHAQSAQKGSGFAIEEARIDIEELVGNVCSYFTYQACPPESIDGQCKTEDMVIYVILTQIKKISGDQLV